MPIVNGIIGFRNGNISYSGVQLVGEIGVSTEPSEVGIAVLPGSIAVAVEPATMVVEVGD